jgi:hypothetical protein
MAHEIHVDIISFALHSAPIQHCMKHIVKHPINQNQRNIVKVHIPSRNLPINQSINQSINEMKCDEHHVLSF